MIETLIGILGVFLTILFGIYTLWRTKKDRKKIALSFSKNECFSLFDKVIKRLNIEIKYNQNKFDNPLIFLNASIKNSGNSDIDKNMIFEPLNIISSEKYKWLEFNVTNKPENGNVFVEKVSDRNVKIQWDLLKKGEEIVVEALVEDLDDDNFKYSSMRFYDSITFNYRITNIDKIDKKLFLKELINRPKRFFLFYLIFGFIYLIIGGISVSVPFFTPKSFDTEFQITHDNQSKSGTIKAISENAIEFSSDKKVLEIPLDTLKKEYSLIISKNKEVKNFRSIYVLPLLGIITLILSIFIFKRSYNRFNDYQKILHTIYRTLSGAQRPA